MKVVGGEIDSGSLLRAAFDSTLDGILIVSSAGQVLAANRAFAELWHMPPELATSGDDGRLLAFVLGQLVDPVGFHREVSRLYESDESRHDRIEFKDGRVLERFTRPLQLEQGRARLWSFRDVTRARRQAEDVAQRERALSRALVRAIPDLVWLKDTAGVYLACNAAFERFFGAPEAAIVGRTDYDFVERAQADFFRAKDREAMEADQPRVNEEWLTFAADGRRALMETMKTPMRDDRGALIGVLGVARDVTERAAAEDAYRGLFDGVAEAIYVHDRDGRFLDVNAAAERMYGFARDALIGATPAVLAAPGLNDLAEASRRIAKAFAGEPQTFEFWGRRANGEVFLKEVRLIRGTYRGQEVVIASADDITERKRREQAIVESEASFRAIFDGVNDGIFLHDAKTGAIIDVNLKMAEMYGIEREAAVRYGPHDLSAGVPPYGPDDAWGWIQRALAGETPVFEWLARRPRDGTLFWVEVSMRRAEIAGKTRVLVNVRDIAERKRAADALAKSRADLQSILDNFPFMVWLKDLGGRYLAVNGPFAEACGVDVGAVVGRDDLELWSRELALKYRADDAEVIASGRRKNVEELLPNRGPEQWVETYKAPLFDADGLVRGTAGFSRVITDRKQAEARLRSALAEKDALLREIHHRVKNNLAVIISLIGLQIAELRDGDTIAKLRDLADRARTMALVHETLYRSPNLSEVDFGGYLELLAARVVAAGSTSAAIALTVESHDVRLHIEQAVPCGLIVNELLTNIMKYAFPPARVAEVDRPCAARVAVARDGGSIVITVADNGVGLPPGLDWGAASTLGLQLVRVLGQQIGARVEVVRDGGTIFRVAFPEHRP